MDSHVCNNVCVPASTLLLSRPTARSSGPAAAEAAAIIIRSKSGAPALAGELQSTLTGATFGLGGTPQSI
jgi:hypothetical protein